MKLPRYANTLVARLIGFGVFLVLLGTVGRYFILVGYIRDNLIDVTSDQQATLARAAAQDINERLTERLNYLNRMAAALPPELLKDPEQLHAWLKDHAQLQSLFSLGIMIADPRGTVLTDYPEIPGRTGRSLAKNPDFAHLLAGNAGVGAPMIGQLTREPLIPMGVTVHNAQGQVQAVLIGISALAAPHFLSFLEEGRKTSSSTFVLVSPNDKLMMDFSGPTPTLQALPQPGTTDTLLDRAMTGFRGSGLTQNALGVDEIAAVAGIPSMGWFVMASVPTSVALTAVEETKSYLLWHLLLLLAIGLPAIGLFVTWVLRPLFRAAEKAEKMARGEIPLEPLPVVRADEVGHLTGAFNRLLNKLAQSQAELQHMAYHDTLTGLANRSLLVDRLGLALAGANRHDTRLAVLFMDLDGFKIINDTMGHEAGDAVLRTVAQRLSSVVRQVDTLARIGGDEFVLLAVDLPHEPDDCAERIARKCIKTVTTPLRIREIECRLGISIGIALCCGDCQPERILAEADKAMYQAKQQGSGSYRIISSCTEHAAVALEL